MIIKDYFITEIKKLADLTGQRIMASVANMFYDELNHTDVNDFQHAMNILKFQDKKITMGNLTFTINIAMTNRMEKENKIRLTKEQANTKLFWQENLIYIKQGRCNRKCINCKVKYCDIIHTHSIQAMKDMLSKTKTLNQVHTEMNNKFEGWNTGFTPNPDESSNLEPF